jgi:Tfp pilus assembly protein PilF
MGGGMTRTLVLLTVSFVLLFTVAGCSNRYLADRQVKAALQLRYRGDTVQSKQVLLEALDRDPYNVGALNAMGMVCESEGNYKEAEIYYQEVYQRSSQRNVVTSGSNEDRGKLLKDVTAEKLKDVRAKISAQK